MVKSIHIGSQTFTPILQMLKAFQKAHVHENVCLGLH
jgi:hypothetical protein